MEKGERQVRFARKRATLDWRIDMIGSLIAFNTSGNKKTPATRHWCSISFDSPWLSEPYWTQRLWNPRWSEPSFYADFWVWSFISLSLLCVTHLCALLDSWEEEARRAARNRRGGYFCVLCFFLDAVTCCIKDVASGSLTVYATRPLSCLRAAIWTAW